MLYPCRKSFFAALLFCFLLTACQFSIPSGTTSLHSSLDHNVSSPVSGGEQETSLSEVSFDPANGDENTSTSSNEMTQEQSAAETSSTQRKLPPAPEKREDLPDPGFVLTDELGQEIYARWEIAMEQGMDAPGGLGEFLIAHPDFLYDQSGRGVSEPWEDPSQAWLILYKGVPPEKDLLNRERLARFAQNMKDGVPDCIVLIQSGAPLDIFPYWFYVLTYSGSGDIYRQDVYSGLHYFYRLGAGTLTETETEWHLISQEGSIIYFPKYGYEPIPFIEVAGQCTTKEEVCDALVSLCIQEGRRYIPENVEIPPHEIQERDPSMPQFGDLSTEQQEQYYVFNLICYFQANGKGYNCGSSYAVAKDLSKYYRIEDLGGNWLLRARPKSAP